MKTNFGKVLVMAAHPDDEVLGMGGTLLWLARQNIPIYIVFLCLGEASRGQKIANEALRVKQASRVAGRLKAKCYLSHNYPDNAFDSVPLLEITKTVEGYINKLEPDTVFTHHGGDLNVDHRLTFQAVMTAARPGKSSVKTIYSFEVLSSTEWQAKTAASAFLPNTYVDIAKYVDKKVKLLEIYERETSSFPHPRSRTGIETLARMRGMESGLEAAEAFELIRGVYSQKPLK